MLIRSALSPIQKLAILAQGAKYDVSCASSGVQRKAERGKLGSTHLPGLCHSWSSDGRCISLLKVLQTNYCTNNCAYCINRCKNDVPRTTFTPEELAQLTYEFYRRNYIEGLFLSSGIYGDPTQTMEKMLITVQLLRTKYNFNGYIHVKILPGAEDNAIESAILWADRVSINLELPTDKSLKLLAPQKDLNQIINTMRKINQLRAQLLDRKRAKYGFYSLGGQSTQVIIGATPETDLEILTLSEYLYKNIKLKRVYYSAYVPLNDDSILPAITHPPLLREHRLYQADWLLRFYKFTINEILNPSSPNLSEYYDPKIQWALNNLHYFPIELTKANYYQLLRVPGIGPISAKRILQARKTSSFSFEDLHKLGVVLKRAKYFITLRGKYYGEGSLDAKELLSQQLIDVPSTNVMRNLELFEYAG